MICVTDFLIRGCYAECPFVHPSELRHTCQLFVQRCNPFSLLKALFNPLVCAKEVFYTQKSAWQMCSAKVRPYFFSTTPHTYFLNGRAVMVHYAVKDIVKCLLLIYSLFQSGYVLSGK